MEKDQNEAPDLADTGYQASVNQARDEPFPASHHEERRQEAVVRNEEHSHARAAARPDRPGQAAADLIEGPAPQGGPGDTRATHVARAGREEDGRPAGMSGIAKTSPGKPEGEVET